MVGMRDVKTAKVPLFVDSEMDRLDVPSYKHVTSCIVEARSVIRDEEGRPGTNDRKRVIKRASLLGIRS